MRPSLVLVSLFALACASAPARPSGPPTVPAGSPDYQGKWGAVWIWADSAGWHLRTTASDTPAAFSGVITPIDGRIEDLRPIRGDARYDQVKLTDRGIEWSLPTMESTEGFDWRVTSGCNRFDVRTRGEATTNTVHLGGTGESPPQMPFELCK